MMSLFLFSGSVLMMSEWTSAERNDQNKAAFDSGITVGVFMLFLCIGYAADTFLSFMNYRSS